MAEKITREQLEKMQLSAIIEAFLAMQDSLSAIQESYSALEHNYNNSLKIKQQDAAKKRKANGKEN